MRHLPRSSALGTAQAQHQRTLSGREAAFKDLKDDLQLRPIFHQLEQRIEAHIFTAFMAYCPDVSLRARPRALAGGLIRAVLDKCGDIKVLDVHFPTADSRTLVLTRLTDPNADHEILQHQLKLAGKWTTRRRTHADAAVELGRGADLVAYAPAGGYAG
jgi:hypothetical protein